MHDNATKADDNHIDDHVDEEIFECLKLTAPKSFFLFAGAGSGKTRSLVKALDRFCHENGNELKIKGRRVGVITFTNAACDEIKKRLNFNNFLHVSTINSFVWELIQSYTSDIKIWLHGALEQDIVELNAAQVKGRTGKASLDRAKSIIEKTEKLKGLPNIKKFVYNPNGDNKGKTSLNHADVIKIAAHFLNTKPLMRSLLINSYPILLIDESQDTNKYLIEAFISVQQENRGHFALGLLGDIMQRIYSDGKVDLGVNLPEDWATPVKVMNHRCPKRVVTLINKIRSDADGQEQRSRTDKPDGFVRFFLVNRDLADKETIEIDVFERMFEITKDENWRNRSSIKTLILEHHMAASRMGFSEMFEPLYKVDSLKTGLLDGSLPGVKLFTNQILPLFEAYVKNDKFAIASIIKKYSPILSKERFLDTSGDQTGLLQEAKKATDQLLSLFENGNDPTLFDVLLAVQQTDIFEIPGHLKIIATRNESLRQESDTIAASEDDDEESDDKLIQAIEGWEGFLKAPFSQIHQYNRYITRQASFDTHQGVKGLEFPRVMVIIDDTESRGFMFSYDKLFGAKDKSHGDIKNEQENNDTSNTRTRRLFYVICSRAEDSLAIVAYTDKPDAVKTNLFNQGWFDESEVISL